MAQTLKVFRAERKAVVKANNKLVEKIIAHMEKNNVGVLSLVKADTDGVYTVTDGSDEMFRVGAIVIPKDLHGERWIGIIDWGDISQDNLLSFLRDTETQTLEWLDEEVTYNRLATPDWYNYVQCIDDTCMFPLDTYYQISEAVEEALPD